MFDHLAKCLSPGLLDVPERVEGELHLVFLCKAERVNGQVHVTELTNQGIIKVAIQDCVRRCILSDKHRHTVNLAILNNETVTVSTGSGLEFRYDLVVSTFGVSAVILELCTVTLTEYNSAYSGLTSYVT